MNRTCALFFVLSWSCAREAPTPSSLHVPALTAPSPEASTETGHTNDAGALAEPAEAASPSAPEPVLDECAPIAAAYEASLRPKLKKCWSDATSKTKERVTGSVRLTMAIDGTGKIANQKLAEKSDLPEPIVRCMIKAFKAEPIDTRKCGFKTITVEEKFPR